MLFMDKLNTFIALIAILTLYITMLGNYFNKNLRQSMQDTCNSWGRKEWYSEKKRKELKQLFIERISYYATVYAFFQNTLLFLNFIIGGLCIYDILGPLAFAYTAFWSLFIAFIWRCILIFLPIIWWTRGK